MKQASIGVVDNSDANTLREYWKSAVANASGVDIGVAFVTGSGLSLIAKSLKKAALRGNVRILTGLYQYFTEPAALSSLLALQSRFKGRLSVRVARDEHFHWKAYFIFRESMVSISIGSSNLTDAGLHSSGELNLTVSLPAASRAFHEIHAVFESEWNRAAKLNKGVIARYQRRRPANVGRAIKVPIAKILLEPGAPRRSKKDMTIATRVGELGFQLTTHQCAGIGKAVAREYKSDYGQLPEQRKEYVDGVPRLVYVYPRREVSRLDRAIKQAVRATNG